jgi:hypothetical protein
VEGCRTLAKGSLRCISAECAEGAILSLTDLPAEIEQIVKDLLACSMRFLAYGLKVQTVFYSALLFPAFYYSFDVSSPAAFATNARPPRDLTQNI